MRDTIALEYMRIIISTERLSDYLDYGDSDKIMEAIAYDSYKMADIMLLAKEGKLSKPVEK